MSAKLWIVATPLGNIEDLSPRARQILQDCDLIACEDTRRAGLLLQALGVRKVSLVSYHDSIELERAPELIARMQAEQLTLALISDAGTPAIADPGFRLVRLAHESGISVSSVPGPSALSAIISVSGIPSDRVLFVGFLPRKKNQMVENIKVWKKTEASVVAFEAANRLSASLETLAEELPGTEICIGRELTKTHEEIRLFSLNEAKAWAQTHRHLKGEVVLMIDTRAGDNEFDWKPILEKAEFLLKRGLSKSDVIKFLGTELRVKKELYRRLSKLDS